MNSLATEIFVCVPQFLFCFFIHYRSRTVFFLEHIFSNIHQCGDSVVKKPGILTSYPLLGCFLQHRWQAVF